MSPEMQIDKQSQADAQVQLRRAVAADCNLLLEWRNRPEIVSLGALNKTVSAEEHAAWYERKLGDETGRIWIVEKDGVPLGQVRLDSGASNEKIISTFILAEHGGRGYGVEAIRSAVTQAFEIWGELRSIRADILPDNARSIRVFKKAGFGTSSRYKENGMISLVSRRPMIVPHNRLTYGANEVAAVAAVVRSGRWANGPRVHNFEGRLQDWAQVKHAVCVGSGMAALRLGLAALGVGRGDVVALPAYSCVALPNAVLANGAEPVIVDVEKHSWNIDLQNSESSTKAVIAVNTFGLPLDVNGLRLVGDRCIEDWAHGFRLAENGVSPTKPMAKIAIQSFYATKLMGVGEGGVVLTDSDVIAEHIRSWRDYSDQHAEGTRLNDKMTDISAAIGIEQLDRLPHMLRRRQELANIYTEAFSSQAWSLDYFDLPLQHGARTWYRYPIFLKNLLVKDIVPLLRAAGVQADMPIFDWRETQTHRTPIADTAFSRIVSLPLYPNLRKVEQSFVIKTLLKILASIREKA